MTSVNGDVLACVEEAVPWRDVLPEQSCYRAQIDAHATKVATDYTVLATKRAQNVKAMWHRQYSNANAVHWRLPERPERRNVLDYLHEVPVATV